MNETTQPMTAIVRSAYAYCQSLARHHYENFPVASRLIPASHRPAVAALYAFARTADDFADEAAYQDRRHAKLDEWEYFLRDSQPPTHPVFVALTDARARFDLPLQLLADLLTAFRMDVDVQRHPDFASVSNYCRYSANPVGRLVLHLFDQVTPENLAGSDAICTALQLTNFWQDVAIDLQKDRIYIPQDDLHRFGVSEDDLVAGRMSPGWAACMQFQAKRTCELFMQGHKLGMTIRGRLGVELRLTWLSGMKILQKTAAVQFNVFHHRPILTKSDMARLLPYALSRRLFARYKP